MEDIIVSVVSFIIYPNITGWLLVLKIICLILSVLAIGFIIEVRVFKTDWLNWWILWDLKEFLTYRPMGLKRLTKEWAKIKKRLETGTESEYKLAILEADSLLNGALRNLRIGLETLEESLKKRVGQDTFSNVEQIKEAHRVRNNIVYDMAYKLDLERAKEILKIYEQALRELSVL